MNIQNNDYLTALAANAGMSSQQLQTFLMNLGHAMVMHGVKTSNMPDIARTYFQHLQAQTAALEKSGAQDHSMLPGAFPSSWLIDKRTITLSTNGIETALP